VNSQLLTLADLPAGWSVDNSGSSTGSIQGCDLKGLDLKSQESARAEAAYKMGTSVPSIDETIAAFSTAERAKNTYTEGTQVIDACKTFTITDSGQKYSGDVGQLSLGASYGDQTKAYQFTVGVQGFNLGIDLVAVLKGSEVMVFGYAELGTPDLATVNSLVAKATAKLA
jgi:hypothetical protein